MQLFSVHKKWLHKKPLLCIASHSSVHDAIAALHSWGCTGSCCSMMLSTPGGRLCRWDSWLGDGCSMLLVAVECCGRLCWLRASVTTEPQLFGTFCAKNTFMRCTNIFLLVCDDVSKHQSDPQWLPCMRNVIRRPEPTPAESSLLITSCTASQYEFILKGLSIGHGRNNTRNCPVTTSYAWSSMIMKKQIPSSDPLRPL